MTLTEEQLAIRRTAVTSTDIAALCGVDPFRSELEVWLDKTGRERPAEEGDATRAARMKWGHRLEPLLRADFGERHGVTVAGPSHTYVRGIGDVKIAATPDGEIPEWGCGWEGKTHSIGLRDQYGPEGTDQIPLRELFQVQTGMLVTGLRAWRLTAFWDGLPHDFSISADDEMHGLIVTLAERWWRDHVVADRPPTADGSAAAHELLARMHPTDTGLIRRATEDERAMIYELRRALADGEISKERVAKHKAAIKQAIGDDAGLQWSEDDSDRITWRKAKDSSQTDWQAAAYDFAGSVQLAASAAVIGDTARDDMGPLGASLSYLLDIIRKGIDVKAHSKPVAGSRRFLTPRHWSER